MRVWEMPGTLKHVAAILTERKWERRKRKGGKYIRGTY
jgi:hypothetical protein